MGQGLTSIGIVVAVAGCGAKPDVDVEVEQPPKVSPVPHPVVHDTRGPSPFTAGLRYYEFAPRPPPPPPPPPAPPQAPPPPQLTAAEIESVVQARVSLYACSPHASPFDGTLVMELTIGADGRVKQITSSGTMSNEKIKSCLKASFMRLRFPAKGSELKVRIPYATFHGG